MSANNPNPVFGIGVTGLDQTMAAINALPPEMGRGAFVAAVKKAAAPVLRTAKDLVPVLYGFLRDCLTSRAKRMRDGTTYICLVGVERGHVFPIDVRTKGPLKGEEKNAEPTKYAHMIEFGTSKMEAIPFLRPAAGTEAVNAVDIFQTEIEKEIDKAVLKVAYGKS